jgi:hypothetical protein
MDMCIQNIAYSIEESTENPVRVSIPNWTSSKDIEEAINIIRLTFPKILVNKNNIRKPAFFIPKGFDRSVFAEDVFTSHYTAARKAKQLADGEKKVYVICPIYNFTIPDKFDIPDSNIDIKPKIDIGEYSLDDCRQYMKWCTSMIIEKLRENHPSFKIGIPKMSLNGVFMDFDDFNCCIAWDTIDYNLWFEPLI